MYKTGLFCFILCFAVILCIFSGCQINTLDFGNIPDADPETSASETALATESIPEPTVNAEEILFAAFKGEAPVITEHDGESLLPDYIADELLAYVNHYAYVDLNHDGQNEMVLFTDSLTAENIVLHYDNGVVYVFCFDMYNKLNFLSQNGHFKKDIDTYQGLSFNDGKYTFITIAGKDNKNDKYIVDNNPCDRETYEKRFYSLSTESPVECVLADFSPDIVYVMHMTYESQPFDMYFVFNEDGYFCSMTNVFSIDTSSWIQHPFFGTYINEGNRLKLQLEDGSASVCYGFSATNGLGYLTIEEGGIFTTDNPYDTFVFQAGFTYTVSDIIEKCASKYDVYKYFEEAS